jgi:hypothetical protein
MAPLILGARGLSLPSAISLRSGGTSLNLRLAESSK